MAFLDQREITHFLAQELFHQFVTPITGALTGTTDTLTPTTLRSIEHTFIELQKSEPHENEAGFVPPLVHSIGNNLYVAASDADVYTTKNQNLWQSNLSQSSLSDCDTRSTPPLSLSSGTTYSNTTQPTRRNMGGRKPTKDANISPEEEERRRIRRERNKAAAARCRKRRVDHTNALVMETEELERKRQHLNEQIQHLKEEYDELDYLLKAHVQHDKCLRKSDGPPDIKPFDMYSQQLHPEERVKTEMIVQHSPPLNTPTAADMFLLPQKKIMFSTPVSKPSRPNSLNVGVTAPQCKNDLSELTGIPLSTPSTGMTFNFDSLMGGGTGLTPVSAPLVPSCSTQQRNIPTSIADLSSPDACGPPKLVSL